MTRAIEQFTGKYAFLSNFYPAPISYGGRSYPTTEHLFQALKSLDDFDRANIAAASTPGVAKRMGRQVKLRSDWELVKVVCMKSCLELKFNTHADLRRKLLETGDAILIEGNTWNDTFWGVCNGEGQNMLGELLMKLRQQYREQESNA